MRTSKPHQNHIKTIAILSILLLGSLVVLDSCNNGNSEPEPQKQGTQPSPTTAASPITDAMIQAAEAAGPDYQFLAAKLRALKQAGNNTGIDDADPTPSTLNNTQTGVLRKLTALHYAAILDNPDIIRALYTLGANIEAKEAAGGGTPLHRAVIDEKLNAVKALLQQPGINVNAKANGGITVLMLAILKNNLAIVQELLEQPGILLDETDDSGKTALDHANGKPAIKVVLKAKGAK